MSGMKKIILAGFSTMLLAAACSDNDLVENPQVTDPAASYTRYMTVSIASNSASSTRAVADYGDKDKGLASEYGVAKDGDLDDIKFYLFDEDGNPYKVAGDVNNVAYDAVYTEAYVGDDWTEDTSTKQLKKTYVVKLSLTDNTTTGPAKIVAVVNPVASEFSTTGAISLGDLRQVELTSAAKCSKANSFLMSNSVYQDPEKTSNVYATNVSAASFAESPEMAMQSPVNIYVERVVSKVGLDPTTDEDSKVLRTYKVTTEESYYTKKTPVAGAQYPEKSEGVKYTEADYQVTEKDGVKYITNALKMSNGTYSAPLTLTLTGWNIFNTLSKSTLEKSIEGLSNDWAWNGAADYRSYWASTEFQTADNLSQKTLKWAEMDTLKDADVAYPFENTLAKVSGKDYNTSILFAGQIKAGEDGLTLFEWRGAYYTKEDMKETWANFSKSIYTDKEGKTSVTADDFKFLLYKGDNYHVYPYIEITTDKQYYHVTSEGVVAYKQDELTDELKQLSYAQYWNNGHCYYFTEIMHPTYKADGTSDTGSVLYKQGDDVEGIVRNHWYVMSINTIVGLGTPVPVSDDPKKDEELVDPEDPDPDPEIDPTRPKDDQNNNWFLDVKCVIQPWQQVTNSLDIISKDTEVATSDNSGSENQDPEKSEDETE